MTRFTRFDVVFFTSMSLAVVAGTLGCTLENGLTIVASIVLFMAIWFNVVIKAINEGGM